MKPENEDKINIILAKVFAVVFLLFCITGIMASKFQNVNDQQFLEYIF